MRFSEISPPLSGYPQRGLHMLPATSNGCALCDHVSKAVKLKRQWVHHDGKTGRIVICTAHDLKPSA